MQRPLPHIDYTDTELLRDLAAGNERAIVHLYDTYFDGLLLFAIDLVKDLQQAEDVTMVAFTRLWERPRIFGGIDQVRGFLYQTVRNAGFDYLDRLSVRRRVHGELARGVAQPDQATAEARMTRAELFRQLYAAVRTLPEIYRQVLELTYQDEKTATEIAELLSVSVDVVRQRKARGIRMLREQLGPSALFLFFLTLSVMDGPFDRYL